MSDGNQRMVDPLSYYNLENYLMTDVRRHFEVDGSLGAFDFFSIVVWKANRAKTHIARRLLRMDPRKRTKLDPIVRELTRSLAGSPDDKARLSVLSKDWGFGLPMATAILSVLWPEEFTVYDVRVCGQLERFANLANRTNFETIWTGYCEYRDAVRSAVPGSISLRDKDRHLWASSVVQQLNRDIATGFERGDI
jgi:hypothetical protein